MRARTLLLALLTIQLGACGGQLVAPEPHWRAEAFAAEQEGARRHARGDYEGAALSFSDAERHFVAVDDATGTQRTRRHQATSRLAAGQAEQALVLLAATPDTDIDTLRLKAQAQLALHQPQAAKVTLTTANSLCGANCPHTVALHLLSARVALAEGRFADAVVLVEAALGTLKGSENSVEIANAYRLLAEARLLSGQAGAALADAERALTLDRQLALPEKIARDWLLIGDIRTRVGAGATALQAYRQARDIAAAAGLKALHTAADAALSKELK